MSLTEYRRKRDFQRTSEPGPKLRKAVSTRRIFVVQHHFASHEHYDFRLEEAGVLKSWAVPKGPTMDPSIKRLAVEVEDHPLEYAKFHGRIPEGSYGAGVVKIWDNGTWIPEGDPAKDLAAGRISFELRGRKLKGRWTLVRMHASERYKGDRNWLLFKTDESHAIKPAAAALKSTRAKSRPAAGRTPRKKAPKKASVERPAFIPPQLATLAEAAPSGEGWVHEAKLDGYRLELIQDQGTVRLYTRSGADWTDRFPAIARAGKDLAGRSLILDGEAVAVAARGVSSFSALQSALKEGAKARLQYHAFDLLFFDGRDLRDHPLNIRRQALEELLGKPARGDVIRISERIVGRDPLATACKRGFEGLVSKRDDALYESRRSQAWIKSKRGARQEFVIVGFTEPQGQRKGLGSLLLAVGEGQGKLRYAGKVGAGFSHTSLSDLRAALDRLERTKSPLAEPPTERPSGILHWVRPKLVAEVSFTEWTPDGLLRHPVFHALREDKAVASIQRENPAILGRADASSTVAGMAITHPERIVYPGSGITKLELARYYELVAPLMLPHLAHRPLSVFRCPEGLSSTCFYQKHWTSTLPGVKTVAVPEGSGGAKPYAVVGDAKGLVALIQYGAMELHPWGSRADKLDAPDRITFDLDPGSDVPWKRVVEGAFALRDLLASLGMKTWLKTSGGKGLHVVLPIERRVSWDVASSFSRAVCERVSQAAEGRYVTVASKAARKGKIFLDWLRNSRGATAVAPWSTRAREGATISMPIRWEEAAKLRGGDTFTLESVASLVRKNYRNPWSELPRAKNRITLELARELLAD
ncbi:MAG TPA: DNA ligase D [Planctomycetota bacterium]|nr:DNA ligase D [Planctomycetota bacterium]